jgi:hypothetical protein
VSDDTLDELIPMYAQTNKLKELNRENEIWRSCRALAEGFAPRSVCITTTEQLIRFDKNELDEMFSKLNSAKYARRVFQQYSRLQNLKIWSFTFDVLSVVIICHVTPVAGLF